MSFHALVQVSKMRAGSAAEKLVALAYADRHNEETGCAYPSLAWLCEFSSLNRKTVIAAVIRLERVGLLTDTGDRQGHTRQIKVYRLNLESIPKPEPSQKRNGIRTGTVPKTAAEQSQKRDTDTVREPSLPPVATQQSESAREISPKDLIPEVVEAWQRTAERFGLPMLRGTLNPARRKKLLARLREHPIEEWQDAFRAFERSKFLRGETGNWRGADFDFLLSPKTFHRTIEGRYDDSAH